MDPTSEALWLSSAKADLETIGSDDTIRELRRIAQHDLRLPPASSHIEGNIELHGRQYWWRRGVTLAEGKSPSLEDDWEPDGDIGQRACDYYLIYRAPKDKEHKESLKRGYTVEAVVVRLFDSFQMSNLAPAAALGMILTDAGSARFRLLDLRSVLKLLDLGISGIRPKAFGDIVRRFIRGSV